VALLSSCKPKAASPSVATVATQYQLQQQVQLAAFFEGRVER